MSAAPNGQTPRLSLVVPVYRNEGSIPDLLAACRALDTNLAGSFEVVFVVDGSPDRSLAMLTKGLAVGGLNAQLLTLSRNFGSFAAIMAGLGAGKGELFAVMAADLQEPPELILEFERALAGGELDVVIGRRTGREDALASRLSSSLFWWLYRRLVQPEMPVGGVDVFACNREFRDHLLALGESNSTLVGLVFWLGFRRGEIPYRRRVRKDGRSAWTLRRKVRYLLDSAFAFSDLPIRTLSVVGTGGMLTAVILASMVLAARLARDIPVPGYAATVITVMFFGGLNSLAVGLLGEYVWRTFENTKGRPNFVVARARTFGKNPGERPPGSVPLSPP